MRRILCGVWSLVVAVAVWDGTHKTALAFAAFLGLTLVSHLLCTVIDGVVIIIKMLQKISAEPSYSHRSTGK